MQSSMNEGHKAHVREADHEQHKEGNRRVVVVVEGVINRKTKIDS